MTPMHTEQSPNESVHASSGSHVHINRFSLPKDPWQLMVAVGFALSILVNIALYSAYRYDSQERDLDRYDDTQRAEKLATDLADIRSQLRTAHELIQAYGLQKAVKGK